MIRYIFFLLFCSSQLIAQESFLIKGTLKDYNGVIYLKYNNKTDSSLVGNGIFVFKGSIDLPVSASLFINDSRPVYFNEFIVEPGELTISVDTSIKNYDGKPSCKVNATVLKGGNTNTLLNSFRNILATEGSTLQNRNVAEKKQFYIEALNKFINQYPKEMASLILVEQASPGFSQPELISFYESLTTNAKSSYYGVRLKIAIDKNDKASVEKPIKEFSQTDINGTTFSISSLRGRYVLIDFWASWCVPCREQNPGLSGIYKKYRSKGFEILGVSLDADRKSWLKAIEQDKLYWLNVSDLRGTQNEVALMFDIKVIPDNILINKEGKIVAKRISSEELEQILSEVL